MNEGREVSGRWQVGGEEVSRDEFIKLRRNNCVQLSWQARCPLSRSKLRPASSRTRSKVSNRDPLPSSVLRPASHLHVKWRSWNFIYLLPPRDLLSLSLFRRAAIDLLLTSTNCLPHLRLEESHDRVDVCSADDALCSRLECNVWNAIFYMHL